MSLGVSKVLISSTILLYVYAEFPFNVKKCREELQAGREIIRKMIPVIAQREFERQTKLKDDLFVKFLKSQKNDDFNGVLANYQCVNETDSICPNITVATLVPSTPAPPTVLSQTTEETEVTAEITRETENYGSTKKIESEENYDQFDEEEVEVPGFLSDSPKNDILSEFLRFMLSSLKKEEDVCNGPKFSGFNSVTEEQMYGQMSIFLTSFGKPLCSICDRYVGHIGKWFKKAHTEMADDEEHIFNLYVSKIPEKETICSILIPTCHEGYISENATTSTNATECLECNICLTGTTILMQKFILVPKNVEWLKNFLNDYIFSAICAELCHSSPANFPYCSCMAFVNKQFDFFMKAAKRIFMPNYLCANTLGWCKPNETPNILHCLKDLCEDLTGDMLLLQGICGIIPDEPEEADKYLNIRRQKQEL